MSDEASGFTRTVVVKNAAGELVGSARVTVNVEFSGCHLGVGECPAIIARRIRYSIADAYEVTLNGAPSASDAQLDDSVVHIRQAKK